MSDGSGQAIWTLLYAIAEDDRDRYLDWFHGSHIPDKLARPGYTWAAHYEHPDAERPDRRGYVAFFGGECTRVFFDPSPAQLRTRQDAITREMMGCRVDGSWIVHCEEWRHPGDDPVAGDAVRAQVLWLDLLDAAGADEALQAWSVQTHAAAAAGVAGCLGVRKWLAASTAPRHALVHEYTSQDAAVRARPQGWQGDAEHPVARDAGPARLATRIWPA